MVLSSCAGAAALHSKGQTPAFSRTKDQVVDLVFFYVLCKFFVFNTINWCGSIGL